MFSIRRSFPLAKSIRKFSAHAGEHEADVARWENISKVMAVVSIVATIANYLSAEHAHRPEKALPYLKIRNKPYPWKECSDCNLLDTACCDEAQGKKTAAPSHH